MIDKQEIQKNFKDLFSFFSHYIIIVFYAKKRDDYLNNHSCKSIVTHIVTFIALTTAILYAISQVYQIKKPLPIIYLPVYIIIFSILYFIPTSIIIDIGKDKYEILKRLKQTVFSFLISVSFNCTIFTIIFCVFIISESYIIYYLMIVIIIVVNIYYYIRLTLKYKQIVSYSDYKRLNILKIVMPLFALAYIYCVLNLVFLCQFNFIYKGEKFVYTFDPIFQEMLDNSSDRDKIIEYIMVNTELTSQFMQDVIVEQKTNKYNLLIEQIEAISNKETDLKNMYERLVFNRNKIMYEYIIEFISISKLVKIELNRLQFVGLSDLTALQSEIENDIKQIQDNIDEFLNMEQVIESRKTDQIVFDSLQQRMKILQEESESIAKKQLGYEYVLGQAAINRLVISEINSLAERRNSIAQKITEEYKKELKLFKLKDILWQ